VRKVMGMLFVVLILGFIASSAVSSSYVASDTQADGNNAGAYGDFWKILDKEAELVATVDGGNLSAAPELIDNSRLGEKNAANISAQIWMALQELMASGVKLFYTADELRAMAENISKNGLPSETVKGLKAQGWTDEQINALEEYISKNADNITEGFNMSSFLENLSMAFVRVGFRYASYETWGLWRWKWSGSKNFTGTMPSNVSINPLLAEEWVSLYGAYLKGNTTGLLNAASSLSARMYGLLTSPSSSGYGSVNGLSFYSGGFVVVKTSSTYDDWGNLEEVTITDAYYWPGALKAYNLSRQIYVTAQAMELGNDNPELRWILNQKVGELRDALRVYVSESVTKTPLKLKPVPLKPLLLAVMDGISTGSATPKSTSPAPLQKKALTPTGGEGALNAKVSVVAVAVNKSYATYRVIVDMSASNNLVTDISISVSGNGLNDNGHVDSLHPDDGTVSWTSTVSEPIRGSGSVTVAGEVKIRYTTTDGPMPTSFPGGDAPAGRGITKEITLDYSKEIRLKNTVDPSKVTFIVQPSAYSISADDSVTFTIAVFNNNDVPVSGGYTLDVVVPEDQGRTGTITFHKLLNVSSGSSTTVTGGPVRYTSPGQFGYHGTFSFGNFQKTVSGTIDVRDYSDNHGSGKLDIVAVSPSPNLPRGGEEVSFTVKVKSTYPTGQNMGLELFVDGNLVDVAQGSINSDSEKTFNLRWLATSGEHSYTVKVYTLVGGQKFIEEEKSGSMSVAKDLSTKISMEIECPSRVGLGDPFECLLQVENNNSETIGLWRNLKAYWDGEQKCQLVG